MSSYRLSAKSLHAFALLLALALLGAQWAGVQHRIAHADRHQAPSASTAVDLNDTEDDIHHSCVAFDAATLADMAGVVPFAVSILPNRHVIALWVAFASWRAPLVVHFSSRAPPYC
jgi:hypothetical protein